jgi:hypothetical protein
MVVGLTIIGAELQAKLNPREQRKTNGERGKGDGATFASDCFPLSFAY